MSPSKQVYVRETKTPARVEPSIMQKYTGAKEVDEPSIMQKSLFSTNICFEISLRILLELLLTDIRKRKMGLQNSAAPGRG